MKIENSKPTARVARAAPSKSASAPSLAASQVAATPDSSSVLGIPQSELTPRVREAIMSLMAEVDALRKELSHNRQRLTELEEIADLDVMLPVLNRRAFMRELTRIISFAERYQVQASMIYVDLDNFKDINDNFGHAAGDAVLRHVSNLLEQNIRTSDAIGRLGGDEFGVILAQANADQAIQKGASLVDLIAKRPLKWEGQAIGITVSHGVYAFEQGMNADDAVANADRAMYENKARRKQSPDK